MQYRSAGELYMWGCRVLTYDLNEIHTQEGDFGVLKITCLFFGNNIINKLKN